MYLSKWVMVITAFCLITLSGCSHASSPVEPGIGENIYPVGDREANHHSLLGLYSFVCHPETGTVDVIPLRDADLHLNALKLLEPPAFLYLTIEGPPQFNGNILDVDIGLRHPFPDQDVYTGFDVCGIIFTHGSITGFGDPDIVMAGDGDTRLLNTDGYTRWWNPTEFPHGDNVFSYIDGMFGNPADTSDFNCTVNGYKYFADGLLKNDPLTVLTPEQRGVFSAGAKNIRHYTIDLSGEPGFNYAIDACWKKPSVIPPENIPDDFPPSANRPEAWNISVTEITNTLHYEESTGSAGGELVLHIDVWDHFNAGSNIIRGESLAGLPFNSTFSPIGGGNGFSTYELDFTGESLTRNGDAEILITVESDNTGYGSSLPDKPVCAYFKHGFNIAISGGWARTWGGSAMDEGTGVAIDGSGNAYVTGYFRETADFDPGPGVDEHTCNGGFDIFLSKFDSNGDFQWARTWGGSGNYLDDRGLGVAIDGNGNAYVTGRFYDTVDFDPGPGVDEHTSNGEKDIFLSKFDSAGNFQWARTWGGSSDSYPGDSGHGVAVDGGGNVYVTGFFGDIVDFDPGPGVDEHTSNGNKEVFLSKFDSNGTFQWALTWGGDSVDSGHGVAIDGSGNACVIGSFNDTVDFDPGPGVDEHTSNSNWDNTFLSKFDSNGTFQWARTWGGDDDIGGGGAAIDGNGNVYVVGAFDDTVDFDPGSGVDEHTSNGEYDMFLCKLDSAGGFQWARTWGGSDYDNCQGVAVDGSGKIYVTGYFYDTVDFDPGPGIDEHTAYGVIDAFLSKFDSAGIFLWGRTWGKGANDNGNAVAIDGMGNAFVTGFFQYTVDFDPGPGVEEYKSNGYYDIFLSKFPSDGNW